MVGSKSIEYEKKIEKAKYEVADVLKNNNLCIGEALVVLKDVKTVISNSYQGKPLKEFM